MGRWRAWWKAVVAGLLVPLLVLTVAEIALRVAGVGFPTSFFRAAPGNAVTSNPAFGWRFFPRVLARRPVVFLFPRAKDPETVRIFVLGGSAAVGTPDPAFSFGRILQVMLEETHPGRDFEVVNAAMTAINSHVVREIAADCAGQSPDLFVVYMGNNEVVGPYGPGTVFQHDMPPLSVIRTSMAVKRLRLAQTLAGAVRRLSGAATPASWQGMAMFLDHRVPADDPRLDTVYGSLRANLGAIVAAGRASGAPVVLSTVASNLADSPPFASVHTGGLSADRLGEFDDAYRAGLAAMAEERYDDAVAAFARASAVDDAFAELRYANGRALLALGRRDEARDELVAARDLDALRFRADSHINDVIREAAEAPGTLLVDAEKRLAAAPESRGIPGDGLFYEHVHLRFAGNYRLAEAIYPAVDSVLGGASAPLPSEERCRTALAYTVWDRYTAQAEMNGMMRRPPFTGQLDHRRREAARLARLRQLRRAAHDGMDGAEKVHRAARSLRPGDLQVTVRLARLLGARGQHSEAATLWRGLTARVPGVDEWQTALAFDLMDSGSTLEAERMVEGVAEQRPWDPEAWMNVAAVQRERGERGAAEEALRRAVEIAPRDHGVRLALASLLADTERLTEALEECREAIRLAPEDAGGHFTLATVLERQGRTDDAVAEYRAAAAADPDMVRAWNNLGDLLFRAGRTEDAEAAFRHAIAADPWHALARFNLADLALATGQLAEAVEQYRRGLELAPDNLSAGVNLAVTLQLTGRPQAAEAQFRTVLARAPRSSLALRGLAWLLATEPAVRNPAEAVALAQEAAALTGGENAEVLETLVVAYLSAGQRDRAAETARRALSVARDPETARRLGALFPDGSMRAVSAPPSERSR